MPNRKAGEIAKPTIAEVLAQFLAEQEGRFSAATVDRYERVVGLLQSCLDNYAYTSLDRVDTALFDRLYAEKGAAHREFCQVFGPEHILKNIGKFLDYFMVRKVIAGRETLRAAGTVTKKLAKWLAEKGYVETEKAENMAERGREAARDLPAAQDLAFDLDDFAEDQERSSEDGQIEGHFAITRVEGSRIWFEEFLSGIKAGPIEVPEDLGRRCRVGWTMSGVLGRVGKAWRLVEAWNVYPR